MGFGVYSPPMVVRMRATRAHRDNRRSHHALTNPAIAACECGAPHVRHRACPKCGKYRGKQAIDIVARKEREQARSKRKDVALRESGVAKTEPATTKEEK